MVRNIVSLSVLAALAGCIVVAKSETHTVGVGIEESTDLGGGLGWDITTRIAADMSSVVVTTTRVQSCTHLRSAVYDEIETESTALSWEGGSPLELVVAIVTGIVFLPVTVISAAVAEGQVAAHVDTKTRKTRSLDAIRATCPVLAANIPVELTLPSGSVLKATTDSEGRALFAIPDAEPDAGTMITRAADQTRSAAFFKSTEACKRERDEMFSRAMVATTVEQRSELLRALPTACGDASARAWSLIATAALEAVGLRCESIRGLAGQVRAIDLDLYGSVFVSEPDIAQCLDGRALVRQRNVACISLQRAQMLSAEQIDDVTERTRILSTLPDCEPPRIDPRSNETLAGDAAAAARAGDCVTVKAIGAELRARGGGRIQGAGFVNDKAIQRCFFGPLPVSVSPAPVSPPPGFFCTTSPVLSDLCFCSPIQVRCEERRRSITAAGAAMNDCMASPNDRCPLAPPASKSGE